MAKNAEAASRRHQRRVDEAGSSSAGSRIVLNWRLLGRVKATAKCDLDAPPNVRYWG